MDLKIFSGVGTAMICALVFSASSALADSVTAKATMQVTSVYAMQEDSGVGQSQVRSVSVTVKSVVNGKEEVSELGPMNQAVSLPEGITLAIDAAGKRTMTVVDKAAKTASVLPLELVESMTGETSLRFAKEDVTAAYAPKYADVLNDFVGTMANGMKSMAPKAKIKITQSVDTSSMICVPTVNKTLTCSYTVFVSFTAKKK